MVTGDRRVVRQVVGGGKKAPGDPRRAAIGYLCAAVVLCVSACADIWGFGDLSNPPDAGGIGGAGMIVSINGSGGSPENGAGGGGGMASAGGATGTGGASAGIGGSGGSSGTGGTSGTGGSGTGGVAGAPGTGGTPGTGGSGTGGTPGTGGAGTGGVAGARGTGGATGIGGMPGTGGAGTGGVAGARGTGGMSGVGGMPGVGGATGTGGAPPCGPTNCATGCCAANRCITARSATQCGMNGAACAACGGCQLCDATGACAINPASNWMVQCASAVLTVVPPTGVTWDPAGVAGDGIAPDPFCQFERPAGVIDANTGAATRTLNDTFTATWNQTVTPGTGTITAADLMSASADTWRVWVGDSEFNGRGTLACQVRPPLQASALIDGRLTVLNLQNCASFTVTLLCQP